MFGRYMIPRGSHGLHGTQETVWKWEGRASRTSHAVWGGGLLSGGFVPYVRAVPSDPRAYVYGLGRLKKIGMGQVWLRMYGSGEL